MVRRTVPTSGNGLLDRLQALAPRLATRHERSSPTVGRVLYRPGERLRRVYFPAGGVLSLIVRSADGRTVEVATTGTEGMTPVPVVLGVRISPLFVVQQAPGEIIAISAQILQQAMRDNERVRTLVLCYGAYALRVAYQATACNALHSLAARTARWLLMSADRAGSDEFYLTQEMLAEMLGRPRQTVNVAMRPLARARLLTVRRGRIRLLDRPALERAACECYRLMSEHYREIVDRP